MENSPPRSGFRLTRRRLWRECARTLNSTPRFGSRPRASLWLAIGGALALVAGGLRFAFLGGGTVQFDEPIATAVVAHLHESRGFDTNWAHTPVGSRFGRAQYNFSSYYLTLAAWDRLLRITRVEGDTGAAPQPLATDFSTTARATTSWLTLLRAFSALAGTLALILAMRLAWAIGGGWLALGVGAWLAVNPQLVQDSHYARPEAFLTLAALGLVLLCVPVRRWSWPRGLAAGALLGFMTACKVSAGLCFWLPFLACWDRDPAGAGEPGTVPWRRRLWRAAAVAGAIVVGFGLGAPAVLGDLRGYGAGLEYLHHSYGRAVGPFSHYGGGAVFDYLARYYFDTIGWWMAAFFGTGLTLAFVERRWRLCLAVYAPVLTTVAFFGAQAVFFERNLSHVVPLLAVGSLWGWGALVERMGGILRRWKPVVLAVGFAAMLLLPAAVTLRLVYRGFSGTSAAMQAAMQAKILERFPESAVYSVEGSLQAGPMIFRWCWNDHGGPFLLLWRLSNERPTTNELDRLHTAFDFVDLGPIPGLFDGLGSPSGLRNYFPCRTQVYLVKGPRRPPD